MAVSQIEEKILGRLAEHTAPTNALLSASLYQVLGLSILLSKKLYKARKLRKLDNTRDTKSLQLYHHIIWLAREGLSITEVYILPYCQDGEQGPECRVMAAKLRASLYHVFCLYHNHPPIRDLNGRSPGSSPSSAQTARRVDGPDSPAKPSPPRTNSDSRKRAGKAALRDPMPSMTSDASYVTNPYSTQTPPPANLAMLGGPFDPRRTPNRPPGLVPIKISPTQAAASFLLPPLNFIPMAKEHFEMAQHLATALLAPTHALRLSIAFEHTAFLWDCAKEHDRARKLARRTIKDVYSSADGLDDEEFADASTLVSSLGAIVRRGSNDSTPRSTAGSAPAISPNQRTPQQTIDRTIAVSPPDRRQKTASPSSYSHIPRAMMRTPERLSTVPEASESIEETPTTRAPTRSPAGSASRNATLSPPVSRLSSRSNAQRRSSSATSAASDKATKRRIVEQAEEQVRSRQNSIASANATRGSNNPSRNGTTAASSGSGGEAAHSRQATPTEGYVRQKSKSPKSSRRGVVNGRGKGKG